MSEVSNAALRFIKSAVFQTPKINSPFTALLKSLAEVFSLDILCVFCFLRIPEGARKECSGTLEIWKAGHLPYDFSCLIRQRDIDAVSSAICFCWARLRPHITLDHLRKKPFQTKHCRWALAEPDISKRGRARSATADGTFQTSQWNDRKTEK